MLRRSRGFTLVEILVVVVIFAVMAATVALSLAGAGGERQLENDVQRLRALVSYACERAELTGRPVGLSLLATGYVFSEHLRTEWKPLADGELRPRKWVAGVIAHLSRDGIAVAIDSSAPEEPQLACFSSGELTPFRLDLALVDHPDGWRMDGTPDGALSLERRNAR
jgi:general secretion pathway protein H